MHRCGFIGEGRYMCPDVASQVGARTCAQMWRHRWGHVHVHRCGTTGEDMNMCTDVASQVRACICAQMCRHSYSTQQFSYSAHHVTALHICTCPYL